MKTGVSLLILLILTCALAACSVAAPTPAALMPPPPELTSTPDPDDALPSCLDSRAEFCQVANTGQVCLQPCADCRRFLVSIEAAWGGSSSCTEVLSQMAAVRVDEGDKSLRFETRYTLRLIDRGPTPITCSADVAPLPPAHLGLGMTDLRYAEGQPVGPYTVWLGDRQVGVIVLPGIGENLIAPVCLPPLPTPTPSPTYPGPTQTRNSFESPMATPQAG